MQKVGSGREFFPKKASHDQGGAAKVQLVFDHYRISIHEVIKKFLFGIFFVLIVFNYKIKFGPFEVGALSLLFASVFFLVQMLTHLISIFKTLYIRAFNKSLLFSEFIFLIGMLIILPGLIWDMIYLWLISR